MSDWDMVWFFIQERANWRAYDAKGVTLAELIQDDIQMDIGNPERRRKVQKIKSFLERKGVGFPVERVEVSKAAKKKMEQGLPPTARIDPNTGEPLDSTQSSKTNNSSNTPDIFIDEQ